MDSYEILEVSRDASRSEIKEAFRKKAMECHPDKGGDNNTFILLTEAYKKAMKEKEESQSDTTSVMADLLKRHYFLERFFTLINDEAFEDIYYWKI